jgi:iron(III) transport system permease protein
MAVDRWLAGFTGCSWSAADVRRDPAGNLLCHAIPAIAIGALDSGLGLSPSLEQASRLLGENGAGTFARVHFPPLRPALVSSALLVFADAMKELPTTLAFAPGQFRNAGNIVVCGSRPWNL